MNSEKELYNLIKNKKKKDIFYRVKTQFPTNLFVRRLTLLLTQTYYLYLNILK